MFKKLIAAMSLSVMVATPALAQYPHEFREQVRFFKGCLFDVPLAASNLQTGSAKRQIVVIPLSPNTAAAADSTVYRGTYFFGRAGSVKRITFGCQTAPTMGTDTLKVLKGSSAGNTMINAATFDANTLVANTAATATLTSTAADLALDAVTPAYAEYSAGVQTVDGIGLEATLEFEPTDY